ncbi:type III secretion system gatekeeper subunit SctW [Pseudomonas fluorescens]
MKVESANDVHPILHLDPLVGTPVSTSTPAPAKVDELAHIFNQEVESNIRALGQRSLGMRIPPTEQFSQLYDQLGHPAQETLAAVSRRFRMQLLQGTDVKQLLALTDGDPARAYVALKYLEAQAGTDVRSSEASLARDASAELEASFGGQIRAGLNTAVTLQAGSVDPQERQALRTLYYTSVVARQSLATMMQALLGVYGGDRFVFGLKVMRKALSDDIAAHASSIPKAQLSTLLLGLQSCGQLSSVLTHCQALIQRLSLEDDPVRLLQRLLGYVSTGLGTTEVKRLADEFGVGNSPKGLVFLNAFYAVVKQLPLALWADSRAREETLSLTLRVMGELAQIERGPVTFADESRTTA